MLYRTFGAYNLFGKRSGNVTSTILRMLEKSKEKSNYDELKKLMDSSGRYVAIVLLEKIRTDPYVGSRSKSQGVA